MFSQQKTILKYSNLIFHIINNNQLCKYTHTSGNIGYSEVVLYLNSMTKLYFQFLEI